MPSFPSLDTSLTDGPVRLRLAAERDIPEVLIAYQDDPSLHLALGEPRPPSGAALGRRSELAPLERAAGRLVVFAILEGDADVCRGEVRVTEVDWSGGGAELRVWVAPGYRGRGIARRAHQLAGQWLRSACGLQPICRGER